MKLSDFIDGALTEIVNGIRSAQEKDKEHGDIAAGGPHTDLTPGWLFRRGDNLYTVVDFDVAVVGESKGDADARRGLWIASVGADGSISSQHTNRLKFSVHVRIPSPGLRRSGLYR